MKGTVTEIAMLPDSSGSFPVTVTVESSRTVSEGSTASVSIVTGVAKDAVTVPTSAVTRNGDRAVVQVLDGTDGHAHGGDASAWSARVGPASPRD